MSASTLVQPDTRPQHVLIGTSPVLQNLQLDIDSAARSTAKVLLTGETGVGKEVVARLIHERSERRHKTFVTINCAGVPDTLLESELFGHTRGSFTDAYRDNPGRLRQAQHGTVFLDEVGEMSLRMQALLLRFLETGEIETVGGTGVRTHLDVRVITATNRDLQEAVASGGFRQDLFYRLNVLHLHIPPLRERASDVEQLLQHFVALLAEQHGLPAPAFSEAALALLTSYAWPGNVRELRNVVEQLVLRAKTDTIEADQLSAEIVGAAPARTRVNVSHQSRVQELLRRVIVGKESFWIAIHPPFVSRDITRDDLRFLVHSGLEDTRGSYRVLIELFNMPPEDYKRFLGFLKQHDCHLPFQHFRRAGPLNS
jgi:two-component system, NtrC family, response regulator HydG